MDSLNVQYKTSKLMISSNPRGAEIFIDGKAQGKTPRFISPITAGKHTIQLSKTNFQSDLVLVDIPLGETQIVFVELGIVKESFLSFD